MAESRQSRYIASSDGLQMQSQATATIAEATAAGVAKVQQGQQQYFEGLIQNNNSVSTLQQQLAQVELAGASRPSSLSQLAQGVVQGLGAEKERRDQINAKKAQAAAAQAKIDAERLKDTTLTKYSAALGDLTDAYASSNWDKGIEQYKTDAVEILKNLPADTDPEVKRLLVEKVHDNSLGRARQVGERLQKDTDELRNGLVDKARSGLMIDISAVVNSIASQSVDDQAQPFMKQAQDIITDFMNTDNGLPRGSKLSIVASALDAVNIAYSKKHSRYLERTAGLQDWKSYASAYKELEAKEAVGQISFDEMRNQIQALNFRYPGMEERVVQRGDQEKRDLALSQTVEGLRKLREDTGARAIANYSFGSETVKALIASAYTDPSFYNKLKNDPQYKDNPQFQEALVGADKLKDFYKQENQVTIAQAEAATVFQKLDFSNFNTLASLNRSIALKQSAGQQLTPTEALAQIQIDQMKQANPNLVTNLELDEKGNLKNPINQQLLDETMRQQIQITENIKQTVLQEVEAKRAALYKEYPELLNYGLLGQTQDAIRAYAKNTAPFVQKEFENIERLKQEAIQQQTPANQYGQQPNFNPSSAYATSVDGNGKVKVVPRSRTQIIRLPDNASVVTPVIAGASAPVTSHWKDDRPGRPHGHAGVDFGASQGARAVALVPGQIVYIGSDNQSGGGGYGGFVDVLGDNGVLYRYAHQAAQVKVGQRVNAGDVVSISDGSGAGAPHLHFEVRLNPGFTNGRYDVTKNYGLQGTSDPLTHLEKLTANNSNVLTPRFNSSAYRTAPQMKVPINSTLSNRGGAVNGSTYQRVGGSPGGASNRITSQRPLEHSQAPFKVNAGQVLYDYGDNLGYAELAKDDKARKAFVDTARTLGVPTSWIVDIARQEAGSLNPQTDHHSPNGNYGLFGFGNDSFNDPSIHRRLRAGQYDTEGQLKLYVQYMKENGWDKILKQRAGNVSIADLWALTRFGTRMRNKYLETQDTNIKTEGSLKYIDELRLLGKWAGRSYSLPGSRTFRSSAVSDQENSGCQTCAQLALSGSFVPHQHSIT